MRHAKQKKGTTLLLWSFFTHGPWPMAHGMPTCFFSVALMGRFDDLFRPFKGMIPIRIEGRAFEVPDSNSLLRCLQYVAMEKKALKIDYALYCANNQCGNCELTLARPAGPERIRACQVKGETGMEITTLPTGMTWRTNPETRNNG